MTSRTTAGVRAVGLVTPRVTRKRRGVVGSVQTMAKADGLAIARATLMPLARAGNGQTTATAAGTVTPKAIRKRPAVVGIKATARNVATMMIIPAADQAGETTNIGAAREVMTIVGMKAGAVRMTTTIAAQVLAAVATAAGRAILRAIPRHHAAVGKTVDSRYPPLPM
jgi:hypothetical protein